MLFIENYEILQNYSFPRGDRNGGLPLHEDLTPFQNNQTPCRDVACNVSFTARVSLPCPAISVGGAHVHKTPLTLFVGVFHQQTYTFPPRRGGLVRPFPVKTVSHPLFMQWTAPPAHCVSRYYGVGDKHQQHLLKQI